MGCNMQSFFMLPVKPDIKQSQEEEKDQKQAKSSARNENVGGFSTLRSA